MHIRKRVLSRREAQLPSLQLLLYTEEAELFIIGCNNELAIIRQLEVLYCVSRGRETQDFRAHDDVPYLDGPVLRRADCLQLVLIRVEFHIKDNGSVAFEPMCNFACFPVDNYHFSACSAAHHKLTSLLNIKTSADSCNIKLDC